MARGHGEFAIRATLCWVRRSSKGNGKRHRKLMPCIERVECVIEYGERQEELDVGE